VYAAGLTQTLAQALQQLGSERALVVHGLDGLDEVSTLGPTAVADLADGCIRTYELDAAEHGFSRATLPDLAGGSAEECAKWLLAVFDGELGPRTDIALLNAAAAIVVSGLAGSLEEGLGRARESVGSGAAKGKLGELRDMTRRV
jgi:anthranilate phosphoribosyltransferase